MQLDLFDDNRDALLRNDVIAALLTRNEPLVRSGLAALSAQCPTDSLQRPFTVLMHTLSSALSSVYTPISSHNEAIAQIAHIQHSVAPAASSVFAPVSARIWLAPLWRSLAARARGLVWRADQPDAHAGWMFLQAQDWSAVADCVQAITSWRRIPVPLSWMAVARFHAEGLDAAWCLLAELAWMDESRFGALARSLQDPIVSRLLQEFDASDAGYAGDADKADNAGLAWFPAFALIAKPSLAAVLRHTQVGANHAPERTARLILELLLLERQGQHAQIIVRRKQLRNLSPALFAHYLATR